MPELAKKKKTRAGYRFYVMKKITETRTILEKFEKLTVTEEDRELNVKCGSPERQTGGHKAI